MTTPIFNHRLLKFAKHLSEIKNHPKQGQFNVLAFCNIINKNYRIEYEVEIPLWIIEEFLNVYPELKKTKIEAIHEELIFDWLAMSDEEFLHCFDVSGVGQIKTQFGGKKLSKSATPQQVAKNLQDLAAYRMAQTRYN